MLKSIAHPFICFMLIFSVLAPSMLPLMDNECAVAILMDANDEDKSKDKESEKNSGEKDLFLTPFSTSTGFFIPHIKAESPECLFWTSDYMVEIFLPPPERLG